MSVLEQIILLKDYLPFCKTFEEQRKIVEQIIILSQSEKFIVLESKINFKN